MSNQKTIRPEQKNLKDLLIELIAAYDSYQELACKPAEYFMFNLDKKR